MANHQYVTIEASSKPQPKKGIPIMYAGAGLLRTLSRIGFEIPAALMAAVEEGRPLSKVTAAAGMKLDVYDLDQQLKLFDISLEQKMRFKAALIHEGLL